MKKAKYTFLALTAGFICILLGIFLGRNVWKHDWMLPPSPVLSENANMHNDTVSCDHSGKIDLNLAQADDLALLPGIGDTIAERIIRYRTETGPFHGIEEIMKVDGIGKKKFEKIKDYITAEG